VKILADWDASPCRLLNPYRRFGLSQSLHFQGQWFPTVWSLRWLWRHYASPKYLYVFTRRHGFRYRKTSIFMNTAPYTLSVKLSDFIVWRHTWRKNLVKCAVLTGSSAELRTVLSSRLWHTELRSSHRESHIFLSLPADTTMASSQGTSVSSNSFSIWTSHDIFLFKYHFLLHILRFLFLFSDSIMADVASE